MEQNSVILYAIIIVVLIGIPVVLSRKTGKNPMEFLFGKRAGRGLFGGKKSEPGSGKTQAAQPGTKKQTNSNRNDFMELISRLATYARKNHFRLIIPGTLSCGGTTAVLTALIITRSKVVGINCFGFGGRVIAAEGEKDWTQVMNGVETTFPSPRMKNLNQEKIVRQVLEETGFAGTDVEIVGVFTSPSVWLSGLTGTNCYSRDDAMKYLKTDGFLKDGGLDPTAVEQALEPRIVRAKKEKEEAGREEEKREESKA